MDDAPMDQLANYRSSSGRIDPVWTLEIQTLAEDSQPAPNSTTAAHADQFEVGSVANFPIVELKISIERDLGVLQSVMEAILHVHSYEEPVIFIREDWASRAAYNPNNDNPNRWWNNGRGLPERITSWRNQCSSWPRLPRRVG